jgi:hypothetical protein
MNISYEFFHSCRHFVMVQTEAVLNTYFYFILMWLSWTICSTEPHQYKIKICIQDCFCLYHHKMTTRVKKLVWDVHSFDFKLNAKTKFYAPFFVIKPTRCTNFTNLFCHENLHVSDRTRMELCSILVLLKAVWHIPLLSVQLIKLLMMDRRTVRNM